MKVKPLKRRLVTYVTVHNLIRKLNKQIKLLEENFTHPSLNTEKLEPKDFNLYSFRIDSAQLLARMASYGSDRFHTPYP